MNPPRVRTIGGRLNENVLIQTSSGSRAYRPGIDEDEFLDPDPEDTLVCEIDDDERDTEPDGWVIPESEE